MAESALALNLSHCVLTSVNRAELPNGGAHIFANTIREIRKRLPHCTIEVLIPDFKGSREALEIVLAFLHGRFGGDRHARRVDKQERRPDTDTLMSRNSPEGARMHEHEYLRLNVDLDTLEGPGDYHEVWDRLHPVELFGPTRRKIVAAQRGA